MRSKLHRKTRRFGGGMSDRPDALSILYVVLEDFGALGAPLFDRGRAHVRHGLRNTPHMHRLAQRGVVFQRAFCQAPLCNPSRTSLLTSRRPMATRTFTNVDPPGPGNLAAKSGDSGDTDDVRHPMLPTLVDMLLEHERERERSLGGGGGNGDADASSSSGRLPERRAAPIVCAGGKIFHAACDKEPRGFRLELGRSLQVDAPRTDGHADGRLRELRDATAAVAGVWPAVPGRSTMDERKTRSALAALANFARRKERFFLAVGLNKAHVFAPLGRCSYPQSSHYEGLHWKQDSAELMPLAPSLATEVDPPLTAARNHDLWSHWSASGGVLARNLTVNQQRETIGRYFACATHADAQLGAMLVALDHLALANRTAVVMHGDHGFSLGRHGRWSKYNLFEDATRIPLIISVPGMAHGVDVYATVEALDIVPTLLELWGVKSGTPLASLEGTSLMPFLRAGAAHASQWPKWFARSEMHEELLVAAKPSEAALVGTSPNHARVLQRIEGGSAAHGATGTLTSRQLYLRTANLAYTLTLVERADGAPRLANGRADGWIDGRVRIVDETLYNHSADAAEGVNRAYDPAYRLWRDRLLRVALREWKVDVGVEATVAPRPNRTRRLEWLRSWRPQG